MSALIKFAVTRASLTAKRGLPTHLPKSRSDHLFRFVRADLPFGMELFLDELVGPAGYPLAWGGSIE